MVSTCSAVHNYAMTDIVYERPYHWFSPSLFAHRVINTVFGIIGFMLAVRLVLILLSANAGAPFVAWVYNATSGLVAPFSGAFPALNLGGFVLDLTTVFAMIGYAIIGWLLLQLLSFLFAGFSDSSRMPLRGL